MNTEERKAEPFVPHEGGVKSLKRGDWESVGKVRNKGGKFELWEMEKKWEWVVSGGAGLEQFFLTFCLLFSAHPHVVEIGMDTDQNRICHFLSILFLGVSFFFIALHVHQI